MTEQSSPEVNKLTWRVETTGDPEKGWVCIHTVEAEQEDACTWHAMLDCHLLAKENVVPGFSKARITIDGVPFHEFSSVGGKIVIADTPETMSLFPKLFPDNPTLWR